MGVPRITMPLAAGDYPLAVMHVPSRANPALAVSLAVGAVAELAPQAGSDNGGVVVVCLPTIKDGDGNRVRFRALAVAGEPDATVAEARDHGLPLDAGLYPVYVPRGRRLFLAIDSAAAGIPTAEVVFYWMEEA